MANEPHRAGPLRTGLWTMALALAAGLMAAAMAQAPATTATPKTTLVLGTVVPQTRAAGRLFVLAYQEAFARLGLAVKIELYPTQRLSVSADQGLVDGDVARVADYQYDHPMLVRVEEALVDTTFSLYAIDPAVNAARLEDLQSAGLRGVYLRGVAICSKSLAPWVHPARLLDVSDQTQAWNMVYSGRVDFICATEGNVKEVVDVEYRSRGAPRRLLDVAKVPLHAYLHRRHAALAPRLAEAIRQMKADGTLERLRTLSAEMPAPPGAARAASR